MSMPSTNEGVLLLIGALFFIIGLVGGGFEISTIKVPTINKYPRIASAAVGALFMSISIFRLVSPPNSGTPTPIPTPVADSNTPLPTLTSTTVVNSTVSSITPTAAPSPTIEELIPISSLSSEQLYVKARSWAVVTDNGFRSNNDSWISNIGYFEPEAHIVVSSNMSITVNTPANKSVLTTMYYNNADVTNDFFLSMDAATVKQTGCEYGLIFRRTVNGDYYRFHIYSSKDYAVELVQKSDDNKLTYTDLIPKTRLPDGVNPTNIAVISQGNNYRFYLDGVYLDEIYNDRIRGGKFGVDVFVCQNKSASFTFENFRINSTDGIAAPLFYEDFSTNEYNWNISPIDDNDLTAKYQLLDNILQISASSKQPISPRILIPGRSFSDFILNFKAEIVKTDMDQPTIRVTFRREDGDNYYQVRIDDDSYDIRVIQNGNTRTLVDWTKDDNINIKPGVGVQITIIMRGANLSLYVDGRKIRAFRDQSLSKAGRISLGTQFYEANQSVTLKLDDVTIQ